MAADTLDASILQRGRQLGWLKVIGAFFILFNTWGLLLGYGAYQLYYQDRLLSSDSASAISWIATVEACLMLFGGPFSGPLFDRGYYKPLVVIGSALQILGVMTLSASSQYYQIMLAQGICIGLGSSMLWTSCLADVASGFVQHRAMALTVAASGSSIGGVIYPIIFDQLVNKVGFGWTVRIHGFVALASALAACATILPTKTHRNKSVRRIIDVSAFTDVGFMAFTTANFFIMMAYYVPFVYLPEFAETSVHDLPTGSDFFGLYLIAIVNGASTVGRVCAGWIAQRCGALETYIFSVVSAAALLFGWTGVHNFAGLIVWSILFGVMTGVIVSLPPAVLPLLCPSLEVLGTRMGMHWVGPALGILVGSPIGGALLTSASKPRAWWPMQIFTGVAMSAGAVCCVICLISLRRRARQ